MELPFVLNVCHFRIFLCFWLCILLVVKTQLSILLREIVNIVKSYDTLNQQWCVLWVKHTLSIPVAVVLVVAVSCASSLRISVISLSSFSISPVFIVYSFICESGDYTFSTFSFTFAWSGDEGNCEWGALQEHNDNQQDRDHQELLFPLKKVKGLSLAFYPILLPSIALSRGCCPVISHLLNKRKRWQHIFAHGGKYDQFWCLLISQTFPLMPSFMSSYVASVS